MNSEKAFCLYTQRVRYFNLKSRCPELSVAHYIEASLLLARCYEKEQCLLLQELFLRRTFYDLLNKYCDPLQTQRLRKQCLDQIYKPLLALKRFYARHDETNKKYLKLVQEMRVLSHEFNPY